MIRVHYQKGGKVTISPSGYPGEKCYEAARPYELSRNGEHTLQAGQGEVAVPVTQVQHQRLGQ